MNLNTATEIATNAAKESTMKKYRIGSILFDRSNHTIGFNRLFDGVKVQNRPTPFSIHSEEMAILRGNRIGIDFPNSTLIVIRLNRRGNTLLAMPCAHCQKLINKFQIPRVFYSNDPFRREFSSKNFKSL